MKGCYPVGIKERFRKNLSEILLQLHISEKTGRGVPRITPCYGKEAYEFRENSIVVKKSFNWINAVGEKMGDKSGDKNKKSPLTRTQTRILMEIRNNPNITKPKLAVQIGIGKTTIDNGIAALKKYGFIERIGSNKLGYWKVLNVETLNRADF